jgi:hypothetical protein
MLAFQRKIASYANDIRPASGSGRSWQGPVPAARLSVLPDEPERRAHRAGAIAVADRIWVPLPGGGVPPGAAPVKLHCGINTNIVT